MWTLCSIARLVLLGSAAAAALPTTGDLEAMLIATSTANAGVGLELGMMLPTGQMLTANSGFACAVPACFPPKLVDQSSSFCFGSATKMLTAIAIMYKVDARKLQLDDLVEPLIDRFLSAGHYNVSLRQRLGPEIQNVTIRYLVSMRSGVPDYDNTQSRNWQLAHPSTDIGPEQILNEFVKPGFTCVPGTCGEYSTTNFVLLGLVLAAVENVTKWEDVDQRKILPPAAAPLLANSSFPTHGLCSSVAHMVHGLTFNGLIPTDTWDVSCTNGWTGGNWAGRASDAAAVVHALGPTAAAAS